MIAHIRAFTKSIFAKLLLGVLVLAMGAFGLEGAFKDQMTNSVISAGSREISPQAFQKIFDNYRDGQTERLGRPVTNDELFANGIHRRMAEDLATQQSFLSWMDSARLKPGDDLLADRVSQIRAFFNPVTNAFDPAAFADALGRAGLTKKAFDQEIRDEIAMLHLNSGMASGLRAPRIFGAMQAAFQLERRDVSWFAVTPAMIAMPGQPTDAQLTAFVKENEARFRRPEFRQLTMVLFSPLHFEKSVIVPEADIRRIYEARKGQLAQAERRTFTQITVRDPRAAPQVVAALRAGRDPASVAAAARAQIVTYTDKPRTSVPDAVVAAAAFGLQPGQVSDPVRSPLGVSVVKVTAVAPGREVSFEEARPDIERALKADETAEKVFDAVKKFEDLRAGGAALLDAARQSGAEIRSIPPVSERGLLPNGQPLGAPQVMLDAAFALPPGGESDAPEDAGEGRYFVLRVDKVTPSALPSITVERQGLSAAWIGREIDRRLKAKANELTERVRKGESIAAVAASVGATAQTSPGLAREQNPLFGPALLQQIFGAKPGEPFNASLPRPNPASPLAPYAVARVDRVSVPPAVIAARAAEARRPDISQGLMGEMAELAQIYARAKVKPKIRNGRIDTQIGAPAAEPPPAGKKK